MEADLISKYLLLSYFIIIFLKKVTNINSFANKLTEFNYSDTYKMSLLITVYLGFSLALVILSDAKNRYPKYMKITNKMGRLGIILLAVYLLIATYNFHNIFADIGKIDIFFMNLAIIGGLLVLYNYYSAYIVVQNKKNYY